MLLMEVVPSVSELDNIINQQAMDLGQQDVRILPENVLTFYRNEYQSAATISIFRQSNCKTSIKYSLKTTHKDAYLVSTSKGALSQNEALKYIDILINQDVPLEQCLMDRFKLSVWIQGRPPIQKKFKVVINYKKDISRIKESTFHGIQITSRTSGGTQSTAPSTSLLGHPLSLTKKSMLKQSKLAHYLIKGEDTDKASLKEQLDEVIKNVEQRRMRLEYLSQQALKYKSRKKFGRCLTVLAIIFSLVMGILFRQVFDVGKQKYTIFSTL